MAAELIEVTGMVLTASPVKEYDKRIELLTKERGRISAFVTGARRVNSAVSACAIPFTFGTYRLYEGRSSYNVQSAQIKKFFAGIADDFDTLCYASYFAELARYFTRENVEVLDVKHHRGIFAFIFREVDFFVTAALRSLCQSRGKRDTALVRTQFMRCSL